MNHKNLKIVIAYIFITESPMQILEDLQANLAVF